MSFVNDSSQSSFIKQLLQSGYLTLPQVQQALIEKRKGERSLTEIIESLTGKSLPLALLQQYRTEQLFTLKILHGLKVVDLETTPNLERKIKPLLDLIPIELCERYQFFPLAIRREAETMVITLAMVHPEQVQILTHLQKILKLDSVRFERQVIQEQDYQQLKQYLPMPQEQSLETLVDLQYFSHSSEKQNVIQEIFSEKIEQSLERSPLPEGITERFQKVENLIGLLAQEFQLLKQEFQTRPQPGASESVIEELEDSRHWETLVQEFVSHSDTIVTDSYEELTDPGDWKKLKEDLEPQQKKIAEQSSRPMRSVPDPWS